MSKSSRAPARPKGPPTWSSPEYIAWADANARKVRIGYADAPETAIARLVYTWKRGGAEERRGPIMSASSGLKDYLVNDVLSLLSREPTVESITMLVLNGTPFMVARRDGVYYDMTGRQVRVQLEA